MKSFSLPITPSAFVFVSWTLALSTPLGAQVPRGKMPGGPIAGSGFAQGHRPPPPLIQVLDLNKDHVISADEIAQASTSLLKLDRNHDGQLTPDELRPPRPQNTGSGSSEPRPPQPESQRAEEGSNEPPEPMNEEMEHPRPVFPLLKALDTDGDGTLSAEEIRNAPKSLKTLDLNGDGQLTPDEFAPPRPPMDDQK